METPDDKGFVHVSWPSRRVPHGGIFHAKVAEPTPEQQNFLKVLLEESKLTIAQRQKGTYTLRQENEEKKIVHEKKVTPMIRPRTSRRRSLSAIRESGIFEIDEYRPIKRGEDREKLKDNLAYQMAYGDKEQQPLAPAPPTRVKRQIKLPTKKEQWNDLVTQIRERADWLAEMEYLGQGEPHRDLVKDQIAERLRALDTLGIDSQCCTARSTASALSTRTSEHSARSKASVASSHSRQSISSCNKSKIRSPPAKSFTKEENVSEYEKLTPLQINYSPRRRV